MLNSNYYYESIIDILQKNSENFINEYYKDDECKPKIIFSVNSDDEYDKIILTLTHGYQSFSNVVFPRDDQYYGYESLNGMINAMYNRTM